MAAVLTILRSAHSGVRWLVVLASLVALIWLIYSLVTSRAYDRTTQRIMTIFSSLIGLQWLIGVVFLIVLGASTTFAVPTRWEHAVIMTLVLVAAHVHMMLKRRPDRVRLIGGLVSIVVALALVYVGVARVGGWASLGM